MTCTIHCLCHRSVPAILFLSILSLHLHMLLSLRLVTDACVYVFPSNMGINEENCYCRCYMKSRNVMYLIFQKSWKYLCNLVDFFLLFFGTLTLLDGFFNADLCYNRYRYLDFAWFWEILTCPVRSKAGFELIELIWKSTTLTKSTNFPHFPLWVICLWDMEASFSISSSSSMVFPFK